MRDNELLKFEDLQDWLSDQEIVYASRMIHGKGSTRHKLTLCVRCNGNFIVRVGATIYWQGMQPSIAVEKYNELV